MAKKISREDEARLPEFGSHEEAREWFSLKYGDAFVAADRQSVGEGVLYTYFLILDRDVFEKGRRALLLGSLVDAGEFLKSHQPIEIKDTGEVHIVH